MNLEVLMCTIFHIDTSKLGLFYYYFGPTRKKARKDTDVRASIFAEHGVVCYVIGARSFGEQCWKWTPFVSSFSVKKRIE